MIALISINSPEYRELAELTWHQNKVSYCKRHGFFSYSREIESHQKMCFEKFRIAKHVFNTKISGQTIDWVFATGCDSLITDFTNDLSAIVSNSGAASLIAIADVNSIINGDNFLVRNDATGRFIVDRILELEDTSGTEQEAMINLSVEFPSMFQIVPQRTFNSYNYAIYNAAPETVVDKLGTKGHWHYGDLLIHFPGHGGHPELIIPYVQEWMGKIKYE